MKELSGLEVIKEYKGLKRRLRRNWRPGFRRSVIINRENRLMHRISEPSGTERGMNSARSILLLVMRRILILREHRSLHIQY
ncbi:MAG: hypothetical protein ACI4F3_07545 [Enterocloster sp.]